MSILNNSLLLGADAGAAGYQISRSLRFNSSDSAFLSRNFSSSATDLKRQTFSFWTKRVPGSMANNWVFAGHNGSAFYETQIYFSGDTFTFSFGGSSPYQCVANGLFRDPGAWCHFLVSVDTTQATAANRVNIYINGAQQTLSTANYPVQNATSQFALNSGTQRIGSYISNQYFYNGYLADIHFIDGQALTPSSFGEFSATTGRWEPKAYTGTYGTNGFRLDFSDNSAATATTLGKDRAGSNNWTPNNLSVTAGAGNDSLVDTPTSYGTDTGAGGEVRGNYCTLNPLSQGPNTTLSNGNLGFLSTSTSFTYRSAFSSIGMTSGKWYFEASAGVFGDDFILGLSKDLNGGTYIGGTSQSWGYEAAIGAKYNNGTFVSTGYTTYTTGDIISVAFDADNGRLFFAKNGSWQGSGNPATGANPAYTGLTSGPYFFGCTAGQNGAWAGLNFGQRPFAYTAPSGFKALCDTNLPAPVVAQPSTVMDVKLYTGNGGTQTISGLGFSPDLVWIKGRVGTLNHVLTDTVRGAALKLASNTTGAEAGTDNGYLSAFGSDGFTVAMGGGAYPGYETNLGTYTYAAWCWDAGSSTVTNTQGSITSQVRANASAGFSVVTYTGNLTAAGTSTVGHGLGIAPSLVITKRRDGASNWRVQHISTSTASRTLFLDATDAEFDLSGNGTLSRPTSSVFSVNWSTGLGVNGQTHVAYCFAPVAGYSAFGSYTGNGSTDGPMVFANMRPRWIMLKRTDTTSNWTIIDTAREGYNVDNDPLYPNLADAEGTADLADILSNGFKLRSTDASVNASGGTYVYAAFAESPFAYSRAR